MLAFAPTRISLSDSRRPRYWHARPTCTRPYCDLYDTTYMHPPNNVASASARVRARATVSHSDLD